MVAIKFIVGKPNGSVERLIAFFLPFFHGTDRYLTLLWLELASEAATAGLSSRQIFILRTKEFITCNYFRVQFRGTLLVYSINGDSERFQNAGVARRY